MLRRGNDPDYAKLIFPKFPPKRVYQKSDTAFIEKRMFALELYFEELLDQYGDIAKNSEVFLDLIKPKEQEICILGDDKTGKSMVAWALNRDLYLKPSESAKKETFPG